MFLGDPSPGICLTFIPSNPPKQGLVDFPLLVKYPCWSPGDEKLH